MSPQRRCWIEGSHLTGCAYMYKCMRTYVRTNMIGEDSRKTALSYPTTSAPQNAR